MIPHHIPWFVIYLVVGWSIRLVMIPVVLRRQMAPGASVAWLGIVFLHPYIGLALYLLVGESRLGKRRAARQRAIVQNSRDPQRKTGLHEHRAEPTYDPAYSPIVHQAEKISGLPVLGSNALDFFDDTAKFREALIADINKAAHSVHLNYYIFQRDDYGGPVADAVIAAKKRGVVCRVLADAVASRFFFRRGGLSHDLMAAGVQVAAALPVAPFKRQFGRMDMRNHRKLAIIDGETGYVGSHNLINPDYGGRRGNPWYDITGRLRGPVVGELSMVFAEDWAFETGEELPVHPLEHARIADVLAQVVATGPVDPDASFRRVQLAAIQCARRELILTTPYFVPDETTLLSLLMAADRGVDVKLLLPEHPDHFFTAAAGRAHYDALLKGGVSIHLFQPGLLHSKTTTVDDAFAIFGSANLDVRSFSLNFELSVLLYGPEITNRLRNLQKKYLEHSIVLERAKWCQRGLISDYGDRAVALLSPLL